VYQYCGSAEISDDLNFDEDVAAFDFQRIDGDLGGGIVRRFAGLRVPDPGVPGADDFAILDHALPERAAAVQADVIHCTQRAVYVGHADRMVAAGEFFGFVGAGEVGFGGQLGEG
jgi:hypothetical protein